MIASGKGTRPVVNRGVDDIMVSLMVGIGISFFGIILFIPIYCIFFSS